MDVELLTIPGCPHAGPALALFRAALDLEGVKDPVTVRELGTEAEAAEPALHGSPTFSIEGADLFPSSATPALACRVYPTRLASPANQRRTRCDRQSVQHFQQPGLSM